MRRDQASTEAAAREQPVYWFLILELAVEKGDFNAAAAAQRELRRMGVEVTYSRRAEDRKAVTA